MEGKTLRRCLLITDACRNVPGKSGAASGLGASEFTKDPPFAELRSCLANEKSRGMPDGSLGVFTHFLLEGLSGKAGEAGKAVTFDALKLYVKGNTSTFVLNKYETAQNPDGRASYGGMVLAPTPLR